MTGVQHGERSAASLFLSVSVTGVQHGERSEASLFLSVSVTGAQHGERSAASLFLSVSVTGAQHGERSEARTGNAPQRHSAHPEGGGGDAVPAWSCQGQSRSRTLAGTSQV